jgi:hypothetical protein
MEVLVDTLFGFYLLPYKKTKLRKSVTKSKFYFFDVGVAGQLQNRSEISSDSMGINFGEAFEHFIVQETRAFLSYFKKDMSLCYWRSTSKDEVDLIIGDEIAIEIKSTESVNTSHLKSLKTINQEGIFKKLYLVSRDPVSKFYENIECIHYKEYLEKLWAGKIV